MKPIIHWFRRDLRLDDNTALIAALNSGRPVIPVFIFDPAILHSDRIGAPRLKFMLHALHSLDASLQEHGSGLLIRHGTPAQALTDLMQETDANTVHYNIDYTPYARHRDRRVHDHMDAKGFHDRLAAVPGSILTADDSPYKVFTPFMKKWHERIQPDKPETFNGEGLHDLNGLDRPTIPTLADLGFAETIDVLEASEKAAQESLGTFMQERIFGYKEYRNRLGNPDRQPYSATSMLSPYIRFGLLSMRRIYWAAQDALADTHSSDERDSVRSFVNELIWHEFYTHILWFYPHIKTENFNEKYDGVPWQQDDALLQAWKDGQTGYPVIDAAMRQLTATGWMHNRARMIVASFLAKDLLIDWREGERHFMQWLLDGDLAANNGGWQWAAGTGTDAQPYFRIFNPVSQSKKFDPDGSFIRCWVPELRDVPDKYIHEPWKMDNPPAYYPPPIVDHAIARKQALKAYETTKS